MKTASVYLWPSSQHEYAIEIHPFNGDMFIARIKADNYPTALSLASLQYGFDAIVLDTRYHSRSK